MSWWTGMSKWQKEQAIMQKAERDVRRSTMLPPEMEKNYAYIEPDLTNEDTIKEIPEELL